MTNINLSIPQNETFTWLQPGAWRKPCIVHVTMVANARQALFGKLTHNGTEAMVEKTPIGWALIHQQRRMLELCPQERFYKPGGTYFDACSKGKLLLMEPHENVFVNPVIKMATEEALKRKAEEKHYSYTSVPVDSQRYRFVALNMMEQMMVEGFADGIRR